MGSEGIVGRIGHRPGEVASRRRRGRRINGVASHGGGEPQGREEGRSVDGAVGTKGSPASWIC